ncbi:hypothetical protein AMECASPLE_020980, partial [Ameca splendens]
MSTTNELRVVITEKLSTATREVLAVVERSVADYEEEASGFRQQIDRLRRQLELLQPQVKLHRGAEALPPGLQSHEVVVVGEKLEEQQLTQNSGVEAADSPGLPQNLSNEGAEPTTIFKRNREDLKDPQDKTPPSNINSLRRIITKKLTTATREVLKVVERTVADYEEAALGFRQEISHQRRQLELLQPQVKDQRRDLQSHEVVVVDEEEEEQQQLTQHT